MTSLRNKKQVNLELDIEKARSEKNWELLTSLLKKYSKLEVSSTSPLESIIQAERYISESNYPNAVSSLNKALTISQNNQEALSYMGIIEWERNDINRAISYFDRLVNPFSNPSQSEIILNNRKINLMIKAFTARGKCYESLGNQQEALTSYLTVMDMYPRYYKNLRQIEPSTKLDIEECYQKIVFIQYKYQGNIQQAIKTIRQCLSIQMGLSMSTFRSMLITLGNILTRSISSSTYQPMLTNTNESNSSLRQQFYIPNDEVEEAILCLQNLELSIQPSLITNNNINNNNVETNYSKVIYDELCLLYSRKSQFYPIVELYEKAISNDSFSTHTWIQLALSLYCSGRYKRSLFIIEECLSNLSEQKNVHLLLLASKICINHLNQLTKGITFAKSAILLINPPPSHHHHHHQQQSHQQQQQNIDNILLSKCYLIIGIAYGKKAMNSKSYNEKQNNQELSLMNLKTSYELDSLDFKNAYHLALIYADIRDTPLALKYVQIALKSNPNDTACWYLLSLLLSSDKNYELAYRTCKHGLSQSPNNIELLLVKAKIELALDDAAQALSTYKTAFTLLTNNSLTSCEESLDEYSMLNIVSNSKQNQGPSSVVSFDLKSTATENKSHKSTLQSVNEGTFDLESESPGGIITSTTSHKESLNSGENSYNCVLSKEVERKIHLWLSLAEAFIQQGMIKDAFSCLVQAEILDPNSPDVYYYHGYLLEAQDLNAGAVQHYQKALTIDASHTKSAIRLATFYFRDNNLLLAENNLTTILRSFDPTNHVAWYQLGLVLKQKSENEKSPDAFKRAIERSSDCFKRAIELDKTSPIISYNTISRYIP